MSDPEGRRCTFSGISGRRSYIHIITNFEICDHKTHAWTRLKAAHVYGQDYHDNYVKRAMKCHATIVKKLKFLLFNELPSDDASFCLCVPINIIFVPSSLNLQCSSIHTMRKRSRLTQWMDGRKNNIFPSEPKYLDHALFLIQPPAGNTQHHVHIWRFLIQRIVLVVWRCGECSGYNRRTIQRVWSVFLRINSWSFSNILCSPWNHSKSNIPNSNTIYSITTVATCIDCNSSSVPYPEDCPSWTISGYGIDDTFHITTGSVCTADDWSDGQNSSNSSTFYGDHPLSICSWNISTERLSAYYYIQDEEWKLFTVDTNGNAYYYNSDDVRYLYQYYHPTNHRWIWAISSFVGDSQYGIYCEMDYEGESVSKCHSWYFYDEDTDSFVMDTDLVMSGDGGGCPVLAEDVCVYGSTKLGICSVVFRVLNLKIFIFCRFRCSPNFILYPIWNCIFCVCFTSYILTHFGVDCVLSDGLNGEYTLHHQPNDYDQWKRDNLYLIYRDNTWYIGNVDLSLIYAASSQCRSPSPYDPTECNEQWSLWTALNVSDSLSVWPSSCETVPAVESKGGDGDLRLQSTFGVLLLCKSWVNGHCLDFIECEWNTTRWTYQSGLLHCHRLFVSLYNPRNRGWWSWLIEFILCGWNKAVHGLSIVYPQWMQSIPLIRLFIFYECGFMTRGWSSLKRTDDDD